MIEREKQIGAEADKEKRQLRQNACAELVDVNIMSFSTHFIGPAMIFIPVP